jgi:hypothetical protein
MKHTTCPFHSSVQQIQKDVKRYGYHVMYVFGDRQSPPFAYTIGLYKTFGAPEIVIIGLSLDMSRFVVNEYKERVKSGERFEDNQFASGFLEGHKCLFLKMHRSFYKWYLAWCIGFYRGKSFPALQMVVPTVTGIWPWDDEATEKVRSGQPVLGTVKLI